MQEYATDDKGTWILKTIIFLQIESANQNILQTILAYAILTHFIFQ